MLKAFAPIGRPIALAPALAALAATIASLPAHADPACAPITAAALEIGVVDCTQAQVWSQLQASRQFPDVFAGTGKMTKICYKATGPAPAFIGKTQVTIAASASGWTTDFTPVLFGGTDNLGTVVTELTITDQRGRPIGNLFTRDTIDLSQIFTTGTSAEEDVIVGGAAVLHHAKGTYRVVSTPEDANATKVKLTNLAGVVCLNGE
jgi:hypothetical protein